MCPCRLNEYYVCTGHVRLIDDLYHRIVDLEAASSTPSRDELLRITRRALDGHGIAAEIVIARIKERQKDSV